MTIKKTYHLIGWPWVCSDYTSLDFSYGRMKGRTDVYQKVLADLKKMLRRTFPIQRQLLFDRQIWHPGILDQ